VGRGSATAAASTRLRPPPLCVIEDEAGCQQSTHNPAHHTAYIQIKSQSVD
jgi:hypothetical protein